MQASHFAELARQPFNLIPVYREVLADLDTPVSAYLKLAEQPYSCLLESVEGGETWGRYSIIGLQAAEIITVRDHQVSVSRNGEVVETQRVDDPLAFVEQYMARYRVPELPELPMFSGGLLGYFGYDSVRYVERRLADSCPPDQLQTPDILLMRCDELVVFDNLAGTVTLICHVDPAAEGAFAYAGLRLDDMQRRLSAPLPSRPAPSLDTNPAALEALATQSMGEQEHAAKVERIREYVLAGDTMQVVLSMRMSLPFTADAFEFYRALRHTNPSPYLYYFDFKDFQVVGSSPEILARLQRDEIHLRPIAGTRRRGHSEAEDLALEQELLADPKELAEHLMLIDLGRNDVGRVAETGSVEVADRMVIERYSHVMHIVSNVTGRIKAGLGAVDVLRAALPAGTLSGAPKVRAMEIIDELETVKRGIYGGAVGYLSWSGDMDTAIAIRTGVIKGGELHIQAGGGIVADSEPRLEFKEIRNKARALFKAASMIVGEGV